MNPRPMSIASLQAKFDFQRPVARMNPFGLYWTATWLYSHRTRMDKSSNTLGGLPHPVIVAIRDNTDHTRILLFSHHASITALGVLLTNTTKNAQFPKSSFTADKRPCAYTLQQSELFSAVHLYVRTWGQSANKKLLLLKLSPELLPQTCSNPCFSTSLKDPPSDIPPYYGRFMYEISHHPASLHMAVM